MNRTAVVNILGSEATAVGRACRCCLAGIQEEACVDVHLTVLYNLYEVRRNHVQDIPVALKTLCCGAAQVSQFLEILPDTHGVVHEVRDAHLVGVGLADADHGGVGIEDLHVVAVDKVGVDQTVRLPDAILVRGNLSVVSCVVVYWALKVVV